jgi:hypothetical protein
MELQFQYADGTVANVRVLPIDRIMFERNFGRSVHATFTGEPLEEHLFWLGWHALKREGKAADDFDVWLSTVADYETQTEPDPPTEATASTTP